MRTVSSGYGRRSFWAGAAPGLTLAWAALVSFAPLSLLFAGAPLPVWSLMTVYAWAQARSGAMPVWLAFAGGALCDALAGTGLGVWALVHVAALALARMPGSGRDKGFGAAWLVFACVAAPGLGLAEWLGRSLGAREVLAVGDFMARAAMMAATYPLVLAPVAALARATSR